jgi:hypothetical protein
MIIKAAASKIALVNLHTRIKARIARIATMPKKKILWVISRSFIIILSSCASAGAGDCSPAPSRYLIKVPGAAE